MAEEQKSWFSGGVAWENIHSSFFFGWDRVKLGILNFFFAKGKLEGDNGNVGNVNIGMNLWIMGRRMHRVVRNRIQLSGNGSENCDLLPVETFCRWPSRGCHMALWLGTSSSVKFQDQSRPEEEGCGWVVWDKKKWQWKLEKIVNLQMINGCWRAVGNRSGVPISTHSSFFADN